MHTRSAELNSFLDSLHKAISERAEVDSDAFLAAEKIMHALQTEQVSGSTESSWLPVCSLLEEAVENVSANAAEKQSAQQLSSNSAALDHARALLALSPALSWWHRTADVIPGSPFANGHANATVVGRGGLEERDDVWVGISLMAPGVEYPEHHHPPEEVYLVLSPGHWQQAGGDWFEPGIGELVYNTPHIMHAMRSGSAPLLATWCLWKGD